MLAADGFLTYDQVMGFNAQQRADFVGAYKKHLRQKKQNQKRRK